MMDEGLLPEPGGVAILAVSAGLDSTVLARCLAPSLSALGITVHLAHVAHELRGAASQDDLAFVEQLGRQLAVPVHRIEGALAPDRIRAIGLEAAAREVRQDALIALAQRLGASCIYLGHHRDDQMETLLLREQEGVPQARNAAMPPRRNLFCRPLLGTSREQLHAVARSADWCWREDHSNRDLRFDRNRIRHEVLPTLRKEDPQGLELMLRRGQAALEGRQALEARLPELYERMVSTESGGHWRLDRKLVAALEDDLAILLLQSLCRGRHRCDRPPLRAALNPLLDGIRKQGRSRLFALGAGWFARVEGAAVELAPRPISHEPVGQRSLGELRHERTIDTADLPAADALALLDSCDAPGRELAAFDADRVRQPLRTVEAGIGRSMQPFGMKGHRKLRDLLAEAGVPRSQRGSWPVVVDADERVLWVPGIRASGEASLEAASDRALLLYTTAPHDLAGGRTRGRNGGETPQPQACGTIRG